MEFSTLSCHLTRKHGSSPSVKLSWAQDVDLTKGNHCMRECCFGNHCMPGCCLTKLVLANVKLPITHGDILRRANQMKSYDT